MSANGNGNGRLPATAEAPRTVSGSEPLDRALLAISAVVVLGTIMSILDTTIVNVAINHLSVRLQRAAVDDPVGLDRLPARARDRHPAHRLGGRPLRHQAPLHDVARCCSSPARRCRAWRGRRSR